MKFDHGQIPCNTLASHTVMSENSTCSYHCHIMNWFKTLYMYMKAFDTVPHRRLISKLKEFSPDKFKLFKN